MSASQKVRVRFAPSPTGPLHLGGIRTALYNFLFAKKNKGRFILRIEDTDRKRFVPNAQQHIIESLKWCNIEIDEGVTVGGKFAPYYQSKRMDIYKFYVEKLLKNNYAYYAFDTPEELEQMRQKFKSSKIFNPQYDIFTRKYMKNSLTLSKKQVKEKLEKKEAYVIRFKMPENFTIILNDIIRGKISFNTSQLDDKILFKSDGTPTYHLANVIDDYLMQISHVIRGEEWLPSYPLHYLLYKSFGWENSMPRFAHLPLILKPSGKGKLSKRDSKQMGFPVFAVQWTDPQTNEKFQGFREAGYLAQAFVNFIALLGWTPDSDKEIFNLSELIELFSLENVNKAGAKFNPQKAKWINHQHLLTMPDRKLASYLSDILDTKNISYKYDYVVRVCALIKNRLNLLTDLWYESNFFFLAPDNYKQEHVKKYWEPFTNDILSRIAQFITHIHPFDKENIETQIKSFSQARGLSMKKILGPLRVIIVGQSRGPGLFEIIEMLGKDEIINRINTGIKKIKL